MCLGLCESSFFTVRVFCRATYLSHVQGQSAKSQGHMVKYGRRPLRSSTDRTLTVPPTNNRFGDRSFGVAGPRLWNSLPISLRQISSLSDI